MYTVNGDVISECFIRSMAAKMFPSLYAMRNPSIRNADEEISIGRVQADKISVHDKICDIHGPQDLTAANPRRLVTIKCPSRRKLSLLTRRTMSIRMESGIGMSLISSGIDFVFANFFYLLKDQLLPFIKGICFGDKHKHSVIK